MNKSIFVEETEKYLTYVWSWQAGENLSLVCMCGVIDFDTKQKSGSVTTIIT